jgi:amino acid adenylation domain-containing protein
MQEGMLFHALYEPGRGVYFNQLSCRFEGRLDEQIFIRSWEKVVERHGILRTSFVWDGLERPLQVVWKRVALEWARQDWRQYREEEQEEQLHKYLTADRRRDFELGRAPLLRLGLMRRGEEDWSFVWSYHHILLDGWCFSLLVGEVFKVYAAERRGEDANLKRAYPYRDYIAWLERQDLTEAEQYWRKELMGFSSPTPLVGELGQERSDGEHQRHEKHLSEELTAGIKELAKGKHVTVNTVMQGCWGLLLSRCGGEGDVVFGATVAGRPAELRGVESMLGLFINTLPVRVRIQEEETAGEYLRRLQREQVEARHYEYSRLAQVQAWSEMPRGVPLFETLLVLENYPVDRAMQEQAVREFRVTKIRKSEQTNYPLTVDVLLGRKMMLRLDYDEGRFEPWVIERLGLHMEQLLRGMVEGDGKRVKDLSLLTQVEWEQVVEVWNARDVDYNNGTVHELFEEQVKRTPDRTAVECGQERLTYRELNQRANQVAWYLRERGCCAESVVGVRLERGPHLLTTILACFKIGAAYLPLETRHPRERHRRMLSESRAAILLVGDEEAAGDYESLLVLDEAFFSHRKKEENPNHRMGEKGLAYVMYTSGSTGAPKGALVEHGGMVNHLWAKVHALKLDAGDRVAQTASQCFDISIWQFLAPLLVGGCTCVLSHEVVQDAEELLKEIEEREVTVVEVVPSMLAAMVASKQQHAEVGATKLSHLRWMIATGEALPGRICREWRKMYPWMGMMNAYGPTECSDDVTHYVAESGEEAEWKGQCVPIGRGLGNIRVYILDTAMCPLPVAIPGEIYVGGICVGRGYMGKPEMTAERFVPDPFSGTGGERLYRTGDRGRWRRDGNIEFLGRTDDQVKIRGHRIELGEVEGVLRKHQKVADAVILVKEEEGGRKQLIAFVVGKNGKEAGEDELRRYVRESLPQYMAPATYVVLESLPLTTNGKVDRKQLLAMAGPGRRRETEYVEARTEEERVLAEIWTELLDVERVGMHDNFFELGGDSILSIQVVAKARERGLKLTPRQIFEEQTIARIVADSRLGKAKASMIPAKRSLLPEWDPPDFLADNIEVDDVYPLSPMQEGMLFHALFEPGRKVYLNQLNCRLRGQLDESAFVRAWNKIVQRHGVLRTSFMWEGLTRPLQVVWKRVELKWERADWRGYSELEVEELLQEYLPSARDFDLDRAPLLRLGLMRRGEQDWSFIWSYHHILLDGWCLSLVVNEVFALYEAERSGTEAELGQVHEYQEYINWLRGQDLKQAERYWRKQLQGFKAPTYLGADREGKADGEDRTAGAAYERVEQALSPELTTEVERLAKREQVTVNTVMQGCWALLLSRYSGERDVVYGTTVAGRPPELDGADRMLGLFINTLPVRVQVEGTEEIGAYLRRVQREQAKARQYEYSPLAEVHGWSEVPRGIPLFESLLVFDNYPMDRLIQKRSNSAFVVTAAHHSGQTNFPLTLNLLPSPQMTLRLGYDMGRFDELMVRRMGRHIEELLRRMVEKHTIQIKDLSLLSDAEWHQVVEEWNGNEVSYREACVQVLFEEQVEYTPDRIALVCGDSHLSYRQLNIRANRMAHHLVKLGVRPEITVGICVSRSLDMVIGLLAILKTGGAYVPLDPGYPGDRLEYMVQDANIEVLLTQQDLDSRISCEGTRLFLDTDWEQISDQDAHNPAISIDPANAAYVMYTSGSTGRPKGVMVSHSGLVNFLSSMQHLDGFKPPGTLLAVTTISFDIAGLEFFMPLIGGGKVVVATREMAMDGVQLRECLRREAVEAMQATPVSWKLLIDAGWDEALDIFCGGEALNWNLADELQKRARTVVNLYGPTETTIWSSYMQLSKNEKKETAFVPIGRPIHNTRIYVLQDEMQLAPVGTIGELFIGGAGVARGYVKRPDLTAERFVPDPYAKEPGARMYRSGDRGRWRQDGSIEFLGRLDDQVKIRGFRIELGEIEAVLLELEGVEHTVVVVREDRLGRKRIVAYVVGRKGQQPGVEELRSYAKKRLPEYMLPAAFVVLPTLPLTANGKVERKQLPAPADVSPDREYVAPRTEGEQILAKVWSELLGVDKIGVEDNFFELGGDSILSIRMRILAESAGLRIDLGILFKTPTIGALTRSQPSSTSVARSSVVAHTNSGSRPPLFWIHPVGGGVDPLRQLAVHLGTDQPFYAIRSGGLDDDSEYTPTLDRLANEYIGHIRRSQASQPYCIGGYSFGVYVAFEMARQLTSAGAEVGTIILLDGDIYTPRQEADRDLYTWDGLAKERGMSFEQREELKLLPVEARLRYIINRTGYHVDETEFHVLNRLLKVNFAHRRAADKYMQELLDDSARFSYPARVVIVRTDGWEADRGPDLGWRRIITGPIETHRISGTHHTCMQEPYVVELAQIISTYLAVPESKPAALGNADYGSKNILQLP